MAIALNFIILAALLAPTICGLARGFVKTAAHLFRFVLAFAVASAFSGPFSHVLLRGGWIQEITEELAEHLAVTLAFLLFFVVSLLALGLIARFLTFLVEKIPLISGLNHILGLGLGFLQGVFYAWIAAHILVLVLPLVFSDIAVFDAEVLKFFYELNPVRLLLELIARCRGGLDVIMVR